MGLTRCKLSKKRQRRLLEFIVLEMTARSAADLLGLHPNTTALYDRKVRAVIVAQLDAAFPEPGHFEVDEIYFWGNRKGKPGAGSCRENAGFWPPHTWRHVIHASHRQHENRRITAHYSAEHPA